jgi:hypothetical protein
MNTIAPRIVKTRDAATAVLRRLGIKPQEYGLFIKKLDVDLFEIDLPKIHEAGPVNSGGKAALKSLKPAKAKVVIKTVKEKAVKAPRDHKDRRVTVSSVAEELILGGMSNENVFAELKARFKLDDSKKSYPSWYRCRLKRQGKIATEK